MIDVVARLEHMAACPSLYSDDEKRELMAEAAKRLRSMEGMLGEALGEVKDLERENEALRALVDGCKEVVYDRGADIDGEEPIDDIARIVGFPEREAP